MEGLLPAVAENDRLVALRFIAGFATLIVTGIVIGLVLNARPVAASVALI